MQHLCFVIASDLIWSVSLLEKTISSSTPLPRLISQENQRNIKIASFGLVFVHLKLGYQIKLADLAMDMSFFQCLQGDPDVWDWEMKAEKVVTVITNFRPCSQHTLF